MSADAFGVGFEQTDAGYGDYPHHYSDLDFHLKLKQQLEHIAQPQLQQGWADSLIKYAATDTLTPLDLDAMADAEDEVTRRELIIVDAAVDDAEALLEGIRSDAATVYDVVWIAPDRDGVEAISAAITEASDLDAVHIVSHGSAGEMQLGNTRFDLNNLAQYAEDIDGWQAHLRQGADLMVYGCNLAATSEGEKFLEALAQTANMDLSASSDLTASSPQGNWALEFNIGVIETELAFDQQAVGAWQGSLATIVVNSSSDDGLAPGITSVDQLLASENQGSREYTLRQAIEAINREGASGTIHTIEFELDDNTINLSSALPTLYQRAIIDGTSDSDYVDAPVITLDGTFGNLFTIDTDGVVLIGLAFEGASGTGVVVRGDDNLVISSEFSGMGNHGIHIYGNDNVIGGSAPGAGNVISNNGGYGVVIEGLNNAGNVIQGNYIGTTADGLAAWGNLSGGIMVTGGAHNLLIGGEDPGARNVIGTNDGDAIFLDGRSYQVDIVNNYIGVGADGETDLGNEGNGVYILSGNTNGSPINTYVNVLDNVIAHNLEDGISLDSSYAMRNVFTGNLMYDNGEIAIDLNNNGRTPNDPGDIDAGANNTANFPDLNNVAIVDGELSISGYVNYNFVAGGSLELHFYYEEADNGRFDVESRYYIGSHTLPYSSTSGGENFNLTFAIDIPDDVMITATSTREFGTSELSDGAYLALGNRDYDPTGEVLIAGSLLQGALLTASNNLADGNGIASPVQYQWRRNGVDITGAVDASYTLTQADVDADITVVASFTDGQGNAESVVSDLYGPVANANDAPVGNVILAGTAAEDQVLSFSHSISDDDGMSGAEFSYQWYRDGAAIEGADGATYILGDTDVGAEITVGVSYTDDYGQLETVLSDPSAAVSAVNDAPVGELTLTGSAIEDQILSAVAGFTDADGLPGSLTYQWWRDGELIAGAQAASYTLSDADVASVIQVSVTYLDGQGFTETLTSAATSAVAAVNDAPVGNVDVVGLLQENQTLSANIVFTDADGLTGPINFQWLRDGEEIDGETASTLRLTQVDVGSSIAVRVSYVDGQGFAEELESSLSAPVANVNQNPSGELTIDGLAREDELLRAQPNFTDLDGLGGAQLSYQWLRDGSEIEGATTATYLLSDPDVGSQIQLVVRYIDDQGTAESITSAPTAAIATINDAPVGQVLIDGSNIEQETLSALVSITDDDGISGAWNYQWYRDGEAITGATGASYTLVDADVDARVRVEVSYTDDQGTLEAVSSDATAAVLNVNSVPDGSVTIAGVAIEDQTLSALIAFTDGDGISGNVSYQWLRNGEAIAGAVEVDYTLGDDDVGQRIEVAVHYTDGHGTAESVLSQDALLVSNINDAPQGSVVLNGEPIQDAWLSADVSLSDADGLPATLGYQWFRDGSEIAGATEASYRLSAEDVGTQVRVAVIYTDAQGTVESVTSLPTAAVAPFDYPTEGSVQVVGEAREDQLLSADLALSDGNGLPGDYRYQWYRDGEAITGAEDATYRLSDSDVGSRIHLQVEFEDGSGFSAKVVSGATAEVANVNDLPTGELALSGAPMEDTVLQAQAALADDDGIPGALAYQWFRNGEPIGGATGETYQLAEADVGAVIHAEVQYRDLQGTLELVRSVQTPAIINLNDLPEGSLTLSGTLAEDSILTVAGQISDEDGLATDLSYQWFRNGVAIEAATATSYQLTYADVGAQIEVKAQYIDGHGTLESVAVATEEAIVMVNHAATGEIEIRGVPLAGSTLYARADIFDSDGFEGFEVQWLRDGDPIADATGLSYTLTGADSGHTLSVLVSFVDDRGFEEEVLGGLMLIEDPNLPTQEMPSGPYEDELDLVAPGATQGGESTASSRTETSAEQRPQGPATQVSPAPSIMAPGHRDEFAASGLIERFGVLDADTGFSAGTTRLERLDNDPGAEIAGADQAFQFVLPDLAESLQLLNAQLFRNDMDRALAEIQKDSISLSTAVIGGSSAVSAGLSVGYVIWTLRSSILITSLLSSMPAWRFIDPLPILSRSGNQDTEDDESLESLVSARQAAAEQGPANPASGDEVAASDAPRQPQTLSQRHSVEA